MLSHSVLSPPLDEIQLNHEVEAFLQGPGPATNSLSSHSLQEMLRGIPMPTFPDKVVPVKVDVNVVSSCSASLIFDENDRTYTPIAAFSSTPRGDRPDISPLTSNNPFRMGPKHHPVRDNKKTGNSTPLLSPTPDSHWPYNEQGAFDISPNLKSPETPFFSSRPVQTQLESTPQAHEVDSHHRDISSPQATLNTKDPSPTEILIVVMGPRGSGKSTYISLAKGSSPNSTGSTVQNNIGMENHFVSHLGTPYHLLDTPGFDDELEADVVTQQVLLWLEDYYDSGHRRENTIILYLHSIGDPRLYGSIRRSLDAFKGQLSPQIWPQVVLGTTGWTSMEKQRPGMAEMRELELVTSSKFWKDMYGHGAGILRVPEQEVFVKDTLGRLGDRILQRRVLRVGSLPFGILADRSPPMERKADILEFERRVLSRTTRVRKGNHRPRLAP
ncbi:hypothetical protein HD806DRAFT_543222 [Xylariaceae sp. AK1471]|nr:hypothetical protein HD806DRAFT_543222 [Xylariaceae sp. AK1471]